MSISNYIHNGFPSLAKSGHYERTRKLGRGLQQTCDNPNCECQEVEKMKNPEYAKKLSEEKHY